MTLIRVYWEDKEGDLHHSSWQFLFKIAVSNVDSQYMLENGLLWSPSNYKWLVLVLWHTSYYLEGGLTGMIRLPTLCGKNLTSKKCMLTLYLFTVCVVLKICLPNFNISTSLYINCWYCWYLHSFSCSKKRGVNSFEYIYQRQVNRTWVSVFLQNILFLKRKRKERKIL